MITLFHNIPMVRDIMFIAQSPCPMFSLTPVNKASNKTLRVFPLRYLWNRIFVPINNNLSRFMVNNMVGLRDKSKIFYPVIKSISVYVVNNLYRKWFKFSPKMFLHDIPMIKDSFSINCNPEVSSRAYVAISIFSFFHITIIPRKEYNV